MSRFRYKDEQVDDRQSGPKAPVARKPAERDPGVAGMLDLQRSAGNAAVQALVGGGVPVQRNPGPDKVPAGLPQPGPVYSPTETTPGGAGVAAAQVIVDGVRGQLDRVALNEEREAALTALMAKQPSIYDTLHANPGKGLTVNLNFKSTDPSTLPTNRPSDYKPKLELHFLGVSVSDPFELPEPTQGPAATPGAAGAGEVGYGWVGKTLTVTVRPVRSDPDKPKKFEIIQSVEALLSYVAANKLPIPLVAGQLKSGRKAMLPTGTIENEPVVEVNVWGTRLLVDEAVAGQAADAMISVARKRVAKDIAAKKATIEDLQGRLGKAAGEGGASRWWKDRMFQIDPHLLDAARAHLAAAEGYLASDDVANAWESVDACDDQLGLVRNQLYAYESNDFTNPMAQDPTNVLDII
jgi:hypothetical protein